MKIAVYGKLLSEETLPFIQQVFDELRTREAEVVLHAEFQELIKDSVKLSNVNTFNGHDDFVDGTDYLITLGGDGTLLDAVEFVRDSGIPVVGINLGRLGFLASTAREDISEAIELLFAGAYTLDSRSLVQLESDPPIFGNTNYALNEFTINKKDSSSMITINAYLNGEYLNTYWADGLIISTPTGSTGYSLSCGGPVIFPNSDSLVITPVAPHNLNIRPLIVPSDVVLSFEIEGRHNNEAFLASLDSRYETIDSKIELAVRKADFTFNLVRLQGQNFLSTLRKKIMWGADTKIRRYELAGFIAYFKRF